jgi:methylmalonyl-CoA/ethylmalonyl-CoA epimerase
MSANIHKINHIGIAVKNLEAQVEFYRDVLGLHFEEIEDLPEQHLKVAVFLAGDIRIELIKSTSPDSAISKFVDKTGGGMHHIAFGVDNIQNTLDNLSDEGVQLIDPRPRKGAGGHRIAFLHPRSTYRVLMELCED